MKTTLLLFFTLISFGLSAQTTYNIPWANDGNSANIDITINVGDTVQWTWGAGTHNVITVSGTSNNTEDIESDFSNVVGNVFSYTFNTVGSTDFECSPHPNNMYGTITVSATAGISENKLLSFEMYPNPVSDVLNIQLPTGTEKAEVGVFDYTGRLVTSKIISSNDNTIDVQKLSKGIYLIRVSSDAKIGAQRFIKN